MIYCKISAGDYKHQVCLIDENGKYLKTIRCSMEDIADTIASLRQERKVSRIIFSGNPEMISVIADEISNQSEIKVEVI